MLRLHCPTSPLWLRIVLHDLDAFLRDHAANERKVAGSALKLAVQHPERRELVDAMIDLAREELDHFKRVYAVLRDRGLHLGLDMPDPYMGALGKLMRRRVGDDFLLDRLLTFAVVERRACERFGLLAEALPEGPTRKLYQRLTRAEARHHTLFVKLARRYFDPALVAQRVDEILAAEAALVARLPLRAALH